MWLTGPTAIRAELRLNIAAAYPPAAHLESWVRTLRLDRGKNEIELADDYVLKQAAKAITLTFMTPCRVAEDGPGKLTLTVAPGNIVNIIYDGSVFTPAVEEIALEDVRLRNTWGERLFRILLRAGSTGLRARWSTRITG